MNDSVTLGLVQQLTPRGTQFLRSGDDDVRGLAVELFVTNLDQRPKFFPKEHLELISQLVRKSVGPECAAACISGWQEPSFLDQTKLVTSYGKITIKDIVAVRKSDFSTEIVGMLAPKSSSLPGHVLTDCVQNCFLNFSLALAIQQKTINLLLKPSCSGSNMPNTLLSPFPEARTQPFKTGFQSLDMIS